MPHPRRSLAAVRRVVYERASGRCEISGEPLRYEDFELHHRRPGGMGGTRRADQHTVPNLLMLAPWVHNMHPLSVHMRPAWAKDRGYLVSTHETDPGGVPVLLLARRWVLLTPDGGYELVGYSGRDQPSIT